jgi:hypothetical protein
MSFVPAKATARVTAGLKKFQPILDEARKRDVNESDTATIVTDMLTEVFGYDKYSEVTSEFAVRSTYCDLAIRLDGELAVLVEVKAVGLELKDNHIKQAVDYAANQGCEWVALTNGVHWQAYQVSFTKPIQADLVLDLNLLALNHRKTDDIELLTLLSREAWQRSRLDDYAIQKQAMSRFTVAAVVLSDPVLSVIRRQLRRISKEVRVETSEIEKVLLQEVLKREATEGEKAEAAKKLVRRAENKAQRASDKKEAAGKGSPPQGTAA